MRPAAVLPGLHLLLEGSLSHEGYSRIEVGEVLIARLLSRSPNKVDTFQYILGEHAAQDLPRLPSPPPSSYIGLLLLLFTPPSTWRGHINLKSGKKTWIFPRVCACDANFQPPPIHRGSTATLITVCFCCRHRAAASISL